MLSCTVRMLALCLCLAGIASAQQPTSSPADIDDEFVHKQFGDTCTLLNPPQPLAGDLNGDNIDDLVMAARCTNPMVDQAEHAFKVIDPYNAFFGYGDTKVTSQFSTEDPMNKGLVLLVIHGAGSDAWRAAAPKEKFVIINLPFQRIAVKKLQLRKKVVTAIYAEESTGNQQNSVIFWDGKKYKYQPMGSAME
ncbi:MAG TPA: hypothetical protein VGF08_01070 [Terriglobales bacterium]